MTLFWNVKDVSDGSTMHVLNSQPTCLLQFHKSTRAYSCATCVHERFKIDFPELHDTYEEVINKQNKTLRALTADFSSQTDLLPPAKEPPPQTTTTDHHKDSVQGTAHQPNEHQTDVITLPLKPIPPPPNTVILDLKEVNSNESRETPQNGDSASKQDPKLITDVPPKISNCIFYLQGRCRHGRLGKDCNYVHPPMCHKFIKNGDKSCKKGCDCKYVHPKLCLRSLSTKECLKPTCSFYHVAGTRRNSDNIPAPQKLMSINGSFHVKSPNGFNPYLFDFAKNWYI